MSLKPDPPHSISGLPGRETVEWPGILVPVREQRQKEMTSVGSSRQLNSVMRELGLREGCCSVDGEFQFGKCRGLRCDHLTREFEEFYTEMQLLSEGKRWLLGNSSNRHSENWQISNQFLDQVLGGESASVLYDIPASVLHSLFLAIQLLHSRFTIDRVLVVPFKHQCSSVIGELV